MLLETESDEMVLQMPQNVFTDHEVTKKATEIWCKYFNAPRARTSQRIDAGVPKGHGQCEAAESTWLGQQRQAILSEATKNPVLVDDVQETARNMSSHLFCPKLLEEEAFQCSKQYKNKLVAYLDNALLTENEVDADCIEVAEAFKDAQAKDDAAAGRARKRRADVLNPQRLPNPVTKFVYFAPGVRQCNLPHLVGDPEHADYIVEQDPADPHEESHWCAFLLGTCICNPDFITSHGVRGVCFNFNKAISSKRKIFISAGFHRESQRRAELVHFACAHVGSNWKVLYNLEEFADASTRAKQQNKALSVIGLFSQAECANLQEKNIMDHEQLPGSAT